MANIKISAFPTTVTTTPLLLTGVQAGVNVNIATGGANGIAYTDGSGKIPTSLLPAAVLGALQYQGTWDALTNAPILVSGVGVKGYFYIVDTSGNTNLDGITDWKVGDYAVFSGTEWQKIDNTETVSSVFGRIGAVVAASGDYSVGQVTGAAPLDSPAFINLPTAPTPATNDNSTLLATTAYVQNQGYVTALTSPVTSVFGRTGAVVSAIGDYAVGQVTGAAPLDSPTFINLPTAPTPLTADNSTLIATTAFVKNQGYSIASGSASANQLAFWSDATTLTGNNTLVNNRSTLEIHEDSFGDPRLYFSDGDVAHGMTSYLPTDVTSSVGVVGSSQGGLLIQAATQSDVSAIYLSAIIGVSNPAATTSAFFIDVGKRSGVSTTSLDANDTAFSIYSSATQLVTIKGDGRFGLGTNNPSYPLHITRSPQNGALIGLVPASIASGDSIYYQILPSVTGFVYSSNVTCSATTGLLDSLSNSGTVANANAVRKQTCTSSGGDPVTTYTISGVLDWTVGIDNSTANDDYKISRSSGLGTNDALIINSNLQTLIRIPYVAKTANYTISAATDGTIDCTSGTFTLTLPTAAGITGAVFNLKNSGVGTITINTTSAQTIDGQASGFWTLSSKTNMTVQSTGSNWIIL